MAGRLNHDAPISYLFQQYALYVAHAQTVDDRASHDRSLLGSMSRATTSMRCPTQLSGIRSPSITSSYFLPMVAMSSQHPTLFGAAVFKEKAHEEPAGVLTHTLSVGASALFRAT